MVGSKKAAQPGPRQSGGSSSSSSSTSWSSLLQEVTRLAAARPAALLTGTQLPDLVSRIKQQAAQADDDDAAFFSVCSTLVTLLSKLLAARKRPREWKQADYSGRVCSVMSASSSLLGACWRRSTTPAAQLSARATMAAAAVCMQQAVSLLLSKVAVAEQEVAQLLSAQLEQQQGMTSPTAPQQQQQQLTALAMQLLGWHVIASDSRCQMLTAATPNAGASLHHAADLWVLLVQSVNADSPANLNAGLAEAAFCVCENLGSLFFGFLPQPRGRSTAELRAAAAAADHCSRHPAVARFLLALVLALGQVVRHSSQGSSSSSSSSSSAAASSSSSSSAAASSSSSSSSASGGSSASNTAASIRIWPHCWQQQQVTDATLQVWEAAGFPRGAFAAFAAAVQQAFPTFTSTLEAARTTGFSLPPTDSALELQAFALVLQLFKKVHSSIVVRDVDGANAVLHTFDSLSRQHQQLMLQQYAWPLPALLLQTAMAAGPGNARLTSFIAAAATSAAITWTMPGLRAAAEAAAAAAGRSSSGQLLSQLLEPMLDAWLLLVGQQLLQPLHSLTSVAGADPAAEAAAIAAAQAALTVLDSLTSLVRLLMTLSGLKAVPVWCRRLPAILLLLDMVHRRVLQPAISSSSSADTSKQLAGGVDRLLLQFDAPPGDGRPPLAQALLTQSEQQPELLQQAFALSISRLKLGRQLQQMGEAQFKGRHFMCSAASVTLVCTCVRAQVSALPPTASLAEARGLLAPWLLLLGLYVQAAGVQLQLWLDQAAPRLEQGFERLLLGPAASSSSSAAGDTVPARDLTGGTLDSQLLLDDAQSIWSAATRLMACIRDQLAQPWAGSNRTQSSTASGSSSLRQQQHAQAEQQQQRHQGASTGAAGAASAGGQAASSGDGSSSTTNTATTAAVYGDLRAEFEAAVADTVHVFFSLSLKRSLGMLGSAIMAAKAQLRQAPTDGSSSSNGAVECWQGVIAQPGLWKRLAAQLVELGSRLCAQLPVPWLCNNSQCTNMAGVCELQLVGGKGKVCGRCMTARYCSRACQAAHWELHRPVCQQMAAAAAAAAAATGGG